MEREAGNFLKIGITIPDTPEGGIEREVNTISGYLLSGLIDIFHIRKPDWTREEVANLLELIPESLHPRLRIHDHFNLTSRYNLAGVHLNSRNPMAPSSAASVSRSCHSIKELIGICDSCWAYVTLSPIYDSISKEGYKSPFPQDLAVLSPIIKSHRVIALGGVTFQRIPYLESVGFSGAALLGDLWRDL